MATLHWKNGAGGDWNTAADWDLNLVPAAADTVLIDAPGTYTVTIALADAVQSLILGDAGATVVDTGTLTVGGALTATAGTFDLMAGGVLSGGTLSAAGGSFAWNGGTLSGATYQGTLDLTAAGAALTVVNGLTATGAGGTGSGTINADGAGASLNLPGTQTIDNVTINAGLPGGVGGTAITFGTLILGAHTILDQVGGSSPAFSGGSTDTGTSLTNNGTIEASATGGATIITTIFVNNGLISAVPGGWLSISGTDITNNGTVSGDVPFSFSGTLTNNGVITETGGGSSAAGAIFVNNGVFNDAGGFGSAAGGWINTGVFNISPISQAYLALIGGTAAAVAGLSLGTIDMAGVGGQLRLEGSQSWQSGTINIGGSAQQITASALTPVAGATSQLILGAQVMINHTAGASTFNTGQLMLNGTVNASAGGGLFTLSSGLLADNGAINVSGGDHVVVSDPVTGTGAITLASGGIAEIASSVASSDSTVFTDTSKATLRIDLGNAAGFKSMIQGFTAGNTIDLTGITATGASWSNGVLTVSAGTAAPITLALAGNYAGAVFHLATDGILATPPGLGFGLYPGTNITVTGVGAPPPPRVYGGAGATLAAAEGSVISAPLASFTDSNTADTASQLSATITWGDGTTSAGIVTGASGAFSVAAVGHAYSDEGSYTTSIAVTNSADLVTTALTGGVTAIEADVLTAGAAPAIAATSGTAFSGTVATFTDSYTANSAADFTATITWGDGTSSAGTITDVNGALSVAGSHIYAAAGTDVVSVKLTDTHGTATATATGAAAISAPAAVTATGLSVLSVSTAGIGPFGVWTAPLFNANGATAPTVPGSATASSSISAADSVTAASVSVNQTVTAAWTSLSTGTATFKDNWSSTNVQSGVNNAGASFGLQGGGQGDANATFHVNLATAGTFAIDWTAILSGTGPISQWGVNTSGPSGEFGLMNMVVSIDGGAALQVANAATVSPTGSFTGTLAAGQHTIAIQDGSNYSGAETTSTGSLTETLNLSINQGGTPPRVYGGAGSVLSRTEGSAAPAPLATFTDSNAADTAGQLSATIAWGDGTTSAGAITGGAGVFSVAAGHAYADEGSYATSITVTNGADGVATVLTGRVTATEGDVLTPGAPIALTPIAGVAVSGTVARFADSYTANTAADLTATISWGDGTTSSGTVADQAGAITVAGTHIYGAAGSDAVSVTLTDKDGTATATASGTATVAPAAVASSTYYLTTGQDDLVGGAGNNTFIAASNTLSNGDVIIGGTGTNTLELAGGGRFDLSVVDTLAKIQVVSAQEGIGAASQTVTLRENTALRVKIGSGPAGAGILINGAQNSDVIQLGAGNDTIILGAGETAIGGGGNAIYKVNQDSIFDTISGGTTGTNTLVITVGGDQAMGANLTGITAVRLSAPTVLTANATAHMAISGSAAGGDTITLGAATQRVIAGGARERILATAVNAGALVSGIGAGSVLEVTSGGTVALNAATSVGTIKLDAATNLTLSKLSFITALGSSGNDTITAGATYQTLTGGGGTDTLVGFGGGYDLFKDKASGLNGDTVKGFLATDKIDVTDMAFAGAVLKATANGGNTLVSLTEGALKTVFTLTGAFSQAGFSLTSDGGAGLLLTHS